MLVRLIVGRKYFTQSWFDRFAFDDREDSVFSNVQRNSLECLVNQQLLKHCCKTIKDEKIENTENYDCN